MASRVVRCDCGQCPRLDDQSYQEELAATLQSLKVEELIAPLLADERLERAEVTMMNGLGLQCQLLVQDSKGLVPDITSAARILMVALLEGMTKNRKHSRSESLTN